ncbi:MAG TPA: MFS transporter [Marmoricola sp.]|nr:MFS transporter [Marmoricola sp.]
MSTPSGTVVPDRAQVHGRSLRRFAVPIICLAQLMATLDVTIVNLALPSIQSDLSLSNAGLAWVVDAYTLAYAGLLLVGGRAGDILGHRRTLAIGIGLFTLCSLLAGLATGAVALLGARAGQGAGAALATPATLSLITTMCPVGPRRTRAMVGYGAMAGVGITLGLVLGGVLTQVASWRWVFLINVPIGLFVLATARQVLPESHGAVRRVDLLGAATGTLALASLVFGVIRAGSHYWGESISTSTLVLGAALLVLFIVIELQVPEPTLPLWLLRHRVRSGAYLVAGLLYACLYPTFFLSGRALQEARGFTALHAGLDFGPLGLGVLAFAFAARRVMTAARAPALVVVGSVATALGAGFLTAFDATSGYVDVLLPALIGIGAGVGTAFVANAGIAMTDVPEQHAGVAAGLLGTFQAVGGTVGVAVVASLAAARTQDRLHVAGPMPDPRTYADALLSGVGLGFTITAVLAVLAALAAVGSVLRHRP